MNKKKHLTGLAMFSQKASSQGKTLIGHSFKEYQRLCKEVVGDIKHTSQASLLHCTNKSDYSGRVELFTELKPDKMSNQRRYVQVVMLEV